MNTLSHRQARSLFHLDTPLDDKHRASLDGHLMACDQCRAYGDLVGQLEKGSWSPYQKRWFEKRPKYCGFRIYWWIRK